MFNKDKKTNEIRPVSQKTKNKQDEKYKSPRNNKDSVQEKSAMRSEGGKN